jgi:uncharacterized membrane protein YhaH (DUF805 family)
MDNIDYDQLADDYGWLVGGAAIAVYIAILVIFLIAYIRIIQKAGYSGWWILVAIVPILNVVMFLVFAFSRWPVLRERDALRSGQGGVPGGQIYPR